MQPIFLSPAQQQQIESCPDLAFYDVERALRIGYRYVHVLAWQDAVPYLGSAFDMLKIILHGQLQADVSQFQRLTRLTLSLIQCLERLDADELAEAVTMQAKDTLVQASLWYEKDCIPEPLSHCMQALEIDNLKRKIEQFELAASFSLVIRD